MVSVVSFLVGCAPVSHISKITQQFCRNSFNMYTNEVNGFGIGTATEQQVVDALGAPLSTDTALDGSTWYMYGVSEDETDDQQTPLCGRYGFRFVNGVLAGVQAIPAYQNEQPQ